MSVNRLHAAALAAMLFPVASWALDIKGLKPGMPLEAVRKIVPSLDQICDGEKIRKNGEILCMYYPLGGQINKWRGSNVEALNTVAGHEIKYIGLSHSDGMLSVVSVVLPSDAYPEVLEAIKEKFGKPSSSQVSTVQNRMGARFEQVVSRWRSGNAILIVSKLAASVDEMSITLMPDSPGKAATEARKEAVKKAAKDL